MPFAQNLAGLYDAYRRPKQVVNAVPQFFIYMSRLLIVFITSWLALSSTEDLGGVVVLSFIVSASFSSTQSLISVVTSLLETFAAAERLFDILDDPPAVTEAETEAESEAVTETETEEEEEEFMMYYEDDD